MDFVNTLDPQQQAEYTELVRRAIIILEAVRTLNKTYGAWENPTLKGSDFLELLIQIFLNMKQE